MKTVLRPAAVLALAALSLAACGSSSSGKASGTSSSSGSGAKESITVTSANFSEDELVADMYADALTKAGYHVTRKLNLGTREIYLRAMENGEVDLVPDYVGSLAQVLNQDENGPNANTTSPVANGDLTQTHANAARLAAAKGLVLLDSSPAADQNGYGVSQATAQKYHLTSLAQIGPLASKLVFGGPPECQTRADCLPALQSQYGAHFASFKALDAGGPLTLQALVNGTVQVGVVFTSDGTAAADHIVILDDPKHVAPVDNITALIRKAKDNPAVDAVINKVDAALTTDELRTLNQQIGVDKADPATLAQQFVSQHGLG